MASKTKVQNDQKKRDPFAYFGGLGDDGDSDELSESDNEEKKTENEKLSFISKSTGGDDRTGEKLPAAEDVLLLTREPEFLKQDKKKQVDWKKLIKDDTKEEEKPIDYSTNAIPPPKTYVPLSEPEKPALGNNSEDFIKAGSKRSSTDDDAESPKKARTDNS